MTVIDSENELTTVAYLAQAAAKPTPLEPGNVYLVVTPDQGAEVINLRGNEYADWPEHKAGTVGVNDVDSFAAYYSKHADADTEVYADRDNTSVVAVLDAHQPDQARWQTHRLVFNARYSEAFTEWRCWDGKPMDQERFAEFIEDNRTDIHEPPAATMLEIAQTLQGTTKAAWQYATTLANGARKLQWSEETNATAGKGGDLTIPTELVLHLPVFERASHADQLTARFRYRLEGGRLRLLYKLDRPQEVITTAFEALLAEVGEKTGATVLRGTPMETKR